MKHLGKMLCQSALGTKIMSTQKKIICTGVKQMQDHELEDKLAFPVLKPSTSCYNTGIKRHLERHYGNLLPTAWILCYASLGLQVTVVK